MGREDGDAPSPEAAAHLARAIRDGDPDLRAALTEATGAAVWWKPRGPA